MNAGERAERLHAAAEVAEVEPVALTVRELMSWFNVGARGYRVVDWMRNQLEASGLQTDPDFASTHIDSQVRLVPIPPEQDATAGDALRPTADVQLRVSSLAAASSGVEAVTPDDTIETACSVMSFNDYSQLAVVAGARSIKGFISWESIGKRRLVRDPEPMFVRHCMSRNPVIVSLNDPLLPVLPTIYASDFVLVIARDQTLAGIITAADITLEFHSLAGPYLLLGEIERRLRRFVDRICDASELQAVALTEDESRVVESAENLTFGELGRLLERPDVWNRLNWRLDRAYFSSQLNEVRIARNSLMHFAEEDGPSDRLGVLERFASTLAALHVESEPRQWQPKDSGPQ